MNVQYKKEQIETLVPIEMERRAKLIGLDTSILKLRDIIPSDLEFKSNSFSFDFSDSNKYELNKFYTIVDINIPKLMCIYGFRIRGNTNPVSIITIDRCKYNKEFTEELCYVEHMIDKEYYLLDALCVFNQWDTIKINYYLVKNNISNIFWLGMIYA